MWRKKIGPGLMSHVVAMHKGATFEVVHLLASVLVNAYFWKDWKDVKGGVTKF